MCAAVNGKTKTKGGDISSTSKAPKKDEAKEGHALMAQAVCRKNYDVILPKGLRENPLLRVRPKDKVLASIVKLPTGEYAIQLTKFTEEKAPAK